MKIFREFRPGVAMMAGIWLIFLVYPAISLVRAGVSTPQLVVGLTLIVAFAVVYVCGFGLSSVMCFRGNMIWLASMLLPVLALIPLIGWFVFSFTAYFVAALVFTHPLRFGLPIAVGLVLGGTALVLAFTPELFWYIASAIWIGPVLVTVMAISNSHESKRAALKEQLTISTERERVARDVHDLLGHSLTVINLKAEVAASLVDADPARARAEIQEISELSRVALAEVRSTVTRLRIPDFSGEVQAARRALTTAGLTADLPEPQAAQRLAGNNAALFSWALRESVTNVIRHAGATRCEVRLTAEKLQVTDDGVGATVPWGNGLSGLSARVREAGGTVVMEPAIPPGTALEGERPGTRLLISMTGNTEPVEVRA